MDANASNTTGGGGVGGVTETKATHAWPRYEAEYLKRALRSERYKYDTQGLDPEQRAVYLDKVTAKFKEEADECLKAEFDQWLEGKHASNDPKGDNEYRNSDGRPVRRWVLRSKESEDVHGGSKVGQARAGWKHTPWGRSSLTHLPGVRDYLRTQKEEANENDLKLQMLAEFGPQNIEEAWMYFKHWVKGRPVSDAVALPARYEEPAYGTRSDFGRQLPQRMHAYDPDLTDRQPEVFASDHNAYNAAVARPGSPPVPMTTEWEDARVRDVKNFREQMENEDDWTGPHLGSYEVNKRAEAAEHADEEAEAVEAAINHDEARIQDTRKQELTAPLRDFAPSLG